MCGRENGGLMMSDYSGDNSDNDGDNDERYDDRVSQLS